MATELFDADIPTRTEVLFIQEVSGVCNSLPVNTDYLKTASRARKDSGAFEKLAQGPLDPETCALTIR